MKSPFLIFLLASSCFVATLSFAADTRVAVVNMGRILNETSEAKTKKAELDKLSKAAQAKLQEKEGQLRQLQTKFESENIKPGSEKTKEYQMKASELLGQMRDQREEVKKNYVKLTKGLTGAALKVIEAYAQNHNIDLVINAGTPESSPVLYNQKTFDITDDILKILNKS